VEWSLCRKVLIAIRESPKYGTVGMIDSIGIEIPVTIEAAQSVGAKLGFRRCTDRMEDGELLPVWERQDVEFWPSSERKLLGNVKLTGSHHLDFEALVNFPSFSVPKFVYGHNVAMLYKLQEALEVFCRVFIRHFGLDAASVAPVSSWGVSRLDLCYNFRIGEENASRMIRYLKRVELARKETLTYPNTVLWKGCEASSKFYGKGPEFLAKDAKEMIAAGRGDLAQELYAVAKEILRFEVTLRRAALQRALTRRSPLVGHIDSDFIAGRLRYYLKKVSMDFRNEIWDIDAALERIAVCCDGMGARATRLAGFYMLYCQVGPERCRTFCSRSRFFEMRKELRDMNIGLLDFEKDLPEDLQALWLDVPSAYAVNADDLPYRWSEDGEELPLMGFGG
jgi:hypothetical protein